MPLKVLIVDDSAFFRQRLREIIEEHPDLSVVGTAGNGAEAVELARDLRPDLVTMDYEMPVLDGVSAVRQIMADRPVPILMLSSLTYEGARVTLDALEAGAVDFITKNFADISRNSAKLKQTLHQRLLAIARQAHPHARTSTPTPATPRRAPAVETPPRRRPLKLVVIGTSTGGPVALAEVLTKLPARFPVPILLVQHMPANFTNAFAERLDRQCQLQVREAKDGDQLRPGLALLAPGGQQLMLDRGGKVKVLAGDDRLNYRPSVDVTFGAAANAYGGDVLAIVLTGMGADGCDGARLLKQKQALVWSQDERSSVIYGMPQAVAKAGHSDRVLALADIADALLAEVG